MKKLTMVLLTISLVACGGQTGITRSTCSGTCNNQIGPKGDSGLNSLVDFERVAVLPAMCLSQSGVLVYSGLDKDLDLILSSSERMASSFVCDGEKGDSGSSGSSCSVSQIVGGAKITCGSSVAYVNNGVAGQNGSSCSVTDTTTGSKITCTDGTTQNIYDGTNGTSSGSALSIYTVFTKTTSNNWGDTGTCINIGEGLSARYYGTHSEGNRVTKIFSNSTCSFIDGFVGYTCSLHPVGAAEGYGSDGDESCYVGTNFITIDTHENDGNSVFKLYRVKF